MNDFEDVALKAVEGLILARDFIQNLIDADQIRNGARSPRLRSWLLKCSAKVPPYWPVVAGS